MRPKETDKYQTLKLIIIVVWLLIDAVCWYLLRLIAVNNNLLENWPSFAFMLFVAISIPLFIILNFTNLKFTKTGMENRLLFGLIKKKRPYSELVIYSINEGKELEIICSNLRLSTFLAKESHKNYEEIKEYLDQWTEKNSTPIPNRFNKWFYTGWKLTGLVLFVLMKVIENGWL